MKQGLTLLELIVVIMIVGILATLGSAQYGRMVEKTRGAEAKRILGDMRKFAVSYRLTHDSITDITNPDLNVGTASDQIPSSCRSSHYFRYGIRSGCGAVTDPIIQVAAWRCSSGGKDPQGSCPSNCAARALKSNLVTGEDDWQDDCNCSCLP